MRTLITAVLLVTVSLGALADCDEGGARQINDCLRAEAVKEDQKLNEAYRRLMTALPQERKQELRIVERTWLDFARKHCEFESSAYAGGSQEGITYQSCIADLTRVRTKQLLESAQCEAGRC